VCPPYCLFWAVAAALALLSPAIVRRCFVPAGRRDTEIQRWDWRAKQLEAVTCRSPVRVFYIGRLVVVDVVGSSGRHCDVWTGKKMVPGSQAENDCWLCEIVYQLMTLLLLRQRRCVLRVSGPIWGRYDFRSLRPTCRKWRLVRHVHLMMTCIVLGLACHRRRRSGWMTGALPSTPRPSSVSAVSSNVDFEQSSCLLENTSHSNAIGARRPCFGGTSYKIVLIIVFIEGWRGRATTRSCSSTACVSYYTDI